MPEPKASFAYIVGPTATGKTELALRVAERLAWPVINCDSVQVYKETNIGTAKPTAEEIKRADHYLFDYIEPPEKLTAAQYLADVRGLISKQNMKQALFVGGSGFYIQALEKGLYPNSQISQDTQNEVEAWIKKEGFTALHKWLEEQDPEFAQKISPNDHYRIRRSIEVMKSQGRTMTELKQSMSLENHSILPVHRSLKVGLTNERPLLRERVEARTTKMLQAGLVEEVESLMSRGFSDWVPMQSVGYKEVQSYLSGATPKEELHEQITTATMQLIKKQMTWFKRDSDIHWFKPDQIEKAQDFIIKWA